MGKPSRKEKATKSRTLSSCSFSSSSSSSDFEFTVSLSPLRSSSNLCPADELFYKGQLLPLHLSPRLSMVRTLLLSPSTRTSTSSSIDSFTTHSSSSSRDSTGSSSNSTDFSTIDCDSSRPSSVSDLEDEFQRLKNNLSYQQNQDQNPLIHHQVKKPKYFSLSRFSSVFRKDQIKNRVEENVTESSSKKTSSSAKDVIRKYLKKVKPFYEKLSSQKQQHQKIQISIKSEVSFTKKGSNFTTPEIKDHKRFSSVSNRFKEQSGRFSQSFSGNLIYPRKKNSNSSCPTSNRSSPTNSGVLCRNKVINGSLYNSESSSINELQNSIQGAIAHCKNSMIQKETMLVSN